MVVFQGNVAKYQKPIMKIPLKLLPLFLLLALPVVVNAQFTFTTNNGALTITGYTGAGGDVTIPDTTNGLPVTGIGNGAFQGKSSLTNVTISTNVTTIGQSAFSNCANLLGVTIPNTVASIGNSAFAFCTSLWDVTLSDGLTSIGYFAFSDCTSLTNVTIPNSVTSIGYSAFFDCTSLTNVIISTNVTSLGPGAFSACTNLSAITVDALNPVYRSVDGILFNQSLTTFLQYPAGKTENDYPIPDSVTNLGSSAFNTCLNLTNVTIPNSVTLIGASAFFDCRRLGAITVAALNPVYRSTDGVLFNQEQTTLIQCPGGKSGSYTVPDGVTNIGNVAFYYCSSLANITLPDSVTIIGSQAFAECTELARITIPNRVTSIGAGAFQGCTFLGSVTLPNSVTNIGNNAFDACVQLKNVTIPASVTSIGSRAFNFCINLKGVFFAGNAPSVGSAAFTISHFGNTTTIYYLPGTTGWGSPFAGLPAVLWNPQAQTSDVSFGVRTNRFGFTITGTPNIPLVVEACTNLASPVWISLQSCNLTNGSLYFSDPQWTNYPSRLYRLRSP